MARGEAAAAVVVVALMVGALLAEHAGWGDRAGLLVGLAALASTLALIGRQRRRRG